MFLLKEEDVEAVIIISHSSISSLFQTIDYNEIISSMTK